MASPAYFSASLHLIVILGALITASAQSSHQQNLQQLDVNTGRFSHCCLTLLLDLAAMAVGLAQQTIAAHLLGIVV
jgi:uncharacterized membrane protein YiaA